jgi:hypothetical protein
MAKYKLNIRGGGVRREDGASIPPTTDNRDWREYLRWLDDGNTPDPAQTPEEIQAEEEAAAQAVIDEKIQKKMRETAIKDLIDSGDLPPDYKDKEK